MERKGKLPLSQKPEIGAPTHESYEQVFGNPLTLPDELRKEFDAKGWVERWVDSKVLYTNQGYHPKGWNVYRKPKGSSGIIGSEEFKTGSDPDGVVRRGTLILAYKTSEEVSRHRQFLKGRADRYKGVNTAKANELRQKGQGNSVVVEGFDENE